MKIIVPEVQYGFVNQPRDNFFKHSAWPSVCKDERGVLYAGASSMRLSHVDPCGKNCMFMSSFKNCILKEECYAFIR